jgi:hypothetical protein
MPGSSLTMCVNGDLSRIDLALIGAFSLFFLSLTIYQGRIAWRSSPAQYVVYLHSWRPRNWQRWPIYGWLWSFSDSVPGWTVWQVRIVLVIGGAMGLFGVVAAATIALHERLGIPTC